MKNTVYKKLPLSLIINIDKHNVYERTSWRKITTTPTNANKLQLWKSLLDSKCISHQHCDHNVRLLDVSNSDRLFISRLQITAWQQKVAHFFPTLQESNYRTGLEIAWNHNDVIRGAVISWWVFKNSFKCKQNCGLLLLEWLCWKSESKPRELTHKKWMKTLFWTVIKINFRV